MAISPAEIRAARLALDLSPAAMAELMGVTRRTVDRWEDGTRAMTGPAEKLLLGYVERKRLQRAATAVAT